MNHTQKVVLDIVMWIERCLCEGKVIKTDTLVKKSGYSHRHIHNTFKKEVGVTPGKYIRNRRMTLAALLVRFTARSIFEISLDLSFNSQQSFNRLFSSQFGCSPLKYRKRTFIDTSKLYPPHTHKYKNIEFKIEHIHEFSLNVAKYQREDYVIGGKNEKVHSIRHKNIAKLLQNHDAVYIASDIDLQNNNKFTVGVRTFIGSKMASNMDNTMSIHHKKYLTVNFKGTWNEYINFNQRLLVNSSFLRVNGYEIEEFRLATKNESSANELIFEVKRLMPI
ncbi:TPA: helix-turn-helix transcriptional regulator [Raoultella planticola]|nr:helix-turn-helix transcriptional regulator [Raoultella planticola]